MIEESGNIDKKKAIKLMRKRLKEFNFSSSDITIFMRYVKYLSVIDILELLDYNEEQLDEDLSIYKNELDEIRRCKREI